MTLYHYKAISSSGEILQGELDAPSEDAVVSHLQDRGYIPVTTTEAGLKNPLSLLSVWYQTRISNEEVALITQQLATLMSADFPLDRALQLLLNLSTDNRPLASVLRAVRDQVREGVVLSDALAAHPRVFSRFYINMVRAGELGGSLALCLERLSVYLEQSQELRRKVVSALIYPAVLLVITLLSLVILLAYVVPRFIPLFAELGGDMPLLTQFVLATGNILRHYWWALSLIAVALLLYSKQQLAHPQGRYRWHNHWLHWKWLGAYIVRVEIARFARTLGTLMDNGVAVLNALLIARQVMSNVVLQQAVESATEAVKGGGALSSALADNKHFPKLAIQVIQIGEETGQLARMLLRVADIYDKEVSTTLERMLSLLVPVTILFLAVMIAVIVMSVLMAILSVNDLFL